MGRYRIGQPAGRGGLKLLAAAVFVLISTLAFPAAAQVISVGDDGAATTWTGPVISSSEGVRAIAPAPVLIGPAPVSEGIRDASARHGVSPDLVEAVAWQESRLNQRAVSPKGAIGVMQLMPSTARDLGVDATDLKGNLDGGAAYLAALLKSFDGDLVKALAAYNAGPAAVRRYGGTPPYPETRAYVSAVLDRLSRTAQTAHPEGR